MLRKHDSQLGALEQGWRQAQNHQTRMRVNPKKKGKIPTKEELYKHSLKLEKDQKNILWARKTHAKLNANDQPFVDSDLNKPNYNWTCLIKSGKSKQTG